jgi:hypothetical protein
VQVELTAKCDYQQSALVHSVQVETTSNGDKRAVTTKKRAVTTKQS